MYGTIGILLSPVPSEGPCHVPAGIDNLTVCWDARLGPATDQRRPPLV
jgi:hypothetical protein